MMNFENKYDVVEINRMAGTDVGSKTDVFGRAETDLENGRLVKRLDSGNYEYVKDATDEIVYLVTTPEKSYMGEGIGDFINLKGEQIRVHEVVLGDTFSTTAVEGEVAEGAKLVAGADGKLVAGADGSVVFQVEREVILGFTKGVMVKRIK